MLKRLNRSCAYFPCHRGLEDCTFCYCPFYPCANAQLGEYVFSKGKGKIWSCKDCSWIHKKKVVDNIFNLLKKISLSQSQRSFAEASASICLRTGIIILGHGSLLKEANDTIIKVIKEIRKRKGPAIIEPAYLQLCKPDLHTAVKKVIKKGCKKVIVVPFFLFRGNHVSRDIPKTIEKEAKAYKGVEFVYAKSLGQDPRISDIVLDCIREAL